MKTSIRAIGSVMASLFAVSTLVLHVGNARADGGSSMVVIEPMSGDQLNDTNPFNSLELPTTLDELIALPLDTVKFILGNELSDSIFGWGSHRDQRRARNLKRSYNDYVNALKSRDRARIVAAAKVHHNNVYTRSSMYTRVWRKMTSGIKNKNFRRSMVLLNSIVRGR